MRDEPVSLVGRLIFIAVSLIKIPQTELEKRICSCGVTNKHFWINEQQYELFSCTLKCHSDAFMAWDISNTDSYNNKDKIVFTLIKLFGKDSSYLLPLFFTFVIWKRNADKAACTSFFTSFFSVYKGEFCVDRLVSLSYMQIKFDSALFCLI